MRHAARVPPPLIFAGRRFVAVAGALGVRVVGGGRDARVLFCKGSCFCVL